MGYWETTFACLILAAVASCDRRTHRYLVLIFLVWIGTGMADAMEDRLESFAVRLVIDVMASLVAALMAYRDARIFKTVPVLFCIMVLNHSTYFLLGGAGINIWSIYANAINVLLVAMLALLAVPGAWNAVLVGSDWLGALGARLCDVRGVPAWRRNHVGDSRDRNDL